MSHQSEQQLENQLIEQLTTLGYEKVTLTDSNALDVNLKAQLEKFNETTFTDDEFRSIYNHLMKGDRFAKAKTLRDKFELIRDDGVFYVRFFNMEQWCKNEYQVTNQITQEGKYTNRYDVTLLINGLPLAQIELKRRGVEMKEAFNQINRYQRDSFTGTLFEYAQVFVISNGVNTKYFSNNHKQSFEQTFFWTDSDNKKITKLEDFAEAFLEKCKLSEMIGEYIVLNESLKIPMILRPYQFYAARAIEKRVNETNKNCYIWHTTGSGKTLTSFKTSQILERNPDITKVLFVVDRKDLDYQTTKEFNSFSDGSVDGTDNTSTLVKQLADPKRKLIVTTIQKLDRAIKSESHLRKIEHLRDERIVILFDECHRNQFGKTHASIKSFFNDCQLIGFTGTPIFAENHVGGTTTKDVFEECLHKYVITHAIADDNVLGFSVEYVGKYTKKEPDTLDADVFADVEVEDIDTKELLESDKRIKTISRYILDDWKRKTKEGKFNALFAVSSIEMLQKYYRELNELKSDDFTIATVFTFHANEAQVEDATGVDIGESEDVLNTSGPVNEQSRDFLARCIEDYNDTFGTNFSTDRFYDYYKDLQKRMKNNGVDLVIVVNMFLTGFDAKTLNTLYVDKNLRYHGLIQAYSRTNRLLDRSKPHGNIVSFRNLKEATDKALQLYGDENAREVVFKKPYDKQKQDFEAKLAEIREIAPSLEAIDAMQSEQEQLDFVKAFRELLRLKSSLETFAEFTFDDVGIDEQTFYDYQSKYLDIHDSRKKNEKGKESILDEINFEIELTVRDVINFDYIIKLIAGLKDVKNATVRNKKKEDILKVFDRDVQLRKKKDLIEKFIEENLPKIPHSDDVEKAFSDYWTEQKRKEYKNVSKEVSMDEEKLEELIKQYVYTQKMPKSQDIVDKLPETPSILKRKTVVDKITSAIEKVVDVFEW